MCRMTKYHNHHRESSHERGPERRAYDKTGEEEERVTSVDFCIGKILNLRILIERAKMSVLVALDTLWS